MSPSSSDLLGLSPGLPHRATIAGVGYALPRTAYGNDQVEPLLGVAPGWIEPRTGVQERRWAMADETVLSLAEAAARAALSDAGVDAGELDHVLVATYTFDRITPNAAPLLARALGVRRGAGTVDVNAACAGWLAAVSYASAMVEAGRAERVLVVASDVITPLTHVEQQAGLAVMADGAGAAVITRASEARPGVIGEIVVQSDATHADMIGGHRNTERAWMRGQETYMVAVAELVAVTREVLDRAGLTLADVDRFVFHQANARILKAVAARLDLDPARTVQTIADTGNVSAATIPLALTRARDDGRLGRGDLVLTAAIGAGYVWAGGLLRWGLGEPRPGS